MEKLTDDYNHMDLLTRSNCGGEIICLRYEKMADYDYDEYGISILDYHWHMKLHSWKKKLQACWRIFRTGYVYKEESGCGASYFDRESMIKIRDDINILLKEGEKNE